MNQEKNNYNDNFSQQNTNTNNIYNNQSLNNQKFNQQPMYQQPMYQQQTNQTNYHQNQLINDNYNNLNSSIKPEKKTKLNIVIGIIAIIIIAIFIIIFVFIKQPQNNLLGNNGSKPKLKNVVYIGGENGNIVRTENGSKWKKINLPSNETIDSSKLITNGISYINGEYILFTRKQGENGGMASGTYLYKSEDCVNWKLSNDSNSKGLPDNWQSLEYINDNYYIISQWGALASRQIYSGKDLNNTKNLFEGDNLFDVWKAYVIDYAYGNGKFVVHVERPKRNYETATGKTKYFYVSKDGHNFSKNETDVRLSEIEFGNNVFVGVSGYQDYGIYKSEDGINWIKVMNFDKWSDNFGIIYRDNNFYIWYNDTIYISNDGLNWKEFYKNNDNQNINNLEYKNGTFAYTSMYTNYNTETNDYEHTFKIFISDDGKNWIESSLNYEDYGFSSIYILENN